MPGTEAPGPEEADHVVVGPFAHGEQAALATRELLLLCHGFCTALTGHHQGDERRLLPVLDTLGLRADPREALGPL